MYSLWALASVAAMVASICAFCTVPRPPDPVTWYNLVAAYWSATTCWLALGSLLLCFTWEADHRKRHSSEMEARYAKALKGE